MKRVFLFVTLLLTLAVSGFAQTTPIPPMMNFQGRLTRPDGTAVPDGNYQITFSIFGATSGGTALWTQTMNPVLVHNGSFAVLLGNGNPLTTDILNGTPYLEIKVGNDAPLPRQQFASVAFAFKANTVPDGVITTAKIANGAVTSAKIQSLDWSKIFNIPSSLLTLPFAGSTSSANSAFSITNNGFGSAAEFSTTNADANNYILPALFVKSLGNRGDGGYFRIYNEANIDNALNAVNEGKGEAGFFSIDNPQNTSAAIYARTANTSTGFAGDFLGLVRMTGFLLNSSPHSGYVLTSDGNGNGTWQAAPTNTGPQGPKGDKGDTGAQGPPGTAPPTRLTMYISGGVTSAIPPGHNFIDVVGSPYLGNNTATLLLPLAGAVPAGTFLSINLTAGGEEFVVRLQPQGGNSAPSVTLSAKTNPTVRLVSNGSNTWSGQ